jgi:hypothetical protein
MSHSLRTVRVLAFGLLPLIWGCTARPLETPKQKPSREDTKFYPQAIEKDIDLLFIVDNSNSMQQEQTNLANQFGLLIQALKSPKLGNKIPNVHIGVISSDLGAGNYGLHTCQKPGGDNGQLQTTARIPGCKPPKDPWIDYNGDSNSVNVDGTEDPIERVKKSFQCIAQLGTGGCGFEHQLEASRKALSKDYNINPGFIRDDAYLAVVWITDEDDCSAQKPQLFDPSAQGLTDPLGPLNSFRCTEFGITCDVNGRQLGPRKNCKPGGTGDYLYKVEDYSQFFLTVKGEGRLILFAIAGPTNTLPDVPLSGLPTLDVGKDSDKPALKPSCQSTMGTAVPAIRIRSLIESDVLSKHGHRGYFNGITKKQREQGEQELVTICSPDFGPALKQLGEVIVASLGGQCLSSPPLTPSGSIACYQGDDLGGGTCTESCLDKVECTVTEIRNQGTQAMEVNEVPKCPTDLFDPSVKECGAGCPDTGCWRIIPNKDCSSAKEGAPYGLHILRKGDAAKGTMAKAVCSTSPFKWGSEEFLKLGQCDK